MSETFDGRQEFKSLNKFHDESQQFKDYFELSIYLADAVFIQQSYLIGLDKDFGQIGFCLLNYDLDFST